MSFGPVLVLDTGSPVVSVAVGRPDRVAATATLPLRRSAEGLLDRIDGALREAGLAARELGRIVVLRGPGSFTGVRVGLATGLGLARSLGLPVGVLGTLDVLAAAAARDCRAAVYAQRGDWMIADYRWDGGPRSLAGPRLVAAAELAAGATLVVGHGLPEDLSPVSLAAPPLAPVALENLGRLEVVAGVEGLAEPVYFRPPAVTGGE